MFACLYLPRPAKPAPLSSLAPARGESGGSGANAALIQLARDFSPRVETHGESLVTLDVSGLGSLLGDARAIGDELRRTAADRGLRLHIAIAGTTTAAILLAQSRAGLVVIPQGEEAGALAPLPLSALESLPAVRGVSLVAPFKRWGLKTLGDLATLPAADLSERLGQDGLQWQRWARGDDARPLVAAPIDPEFEEALDLDWPIDGLEPLSFVFARLFDPLSERLEQRDRGAVVLHVSLTLVTKQHHERTLQLPAPMRDARVLRMLALLDLESNPPPARIDRVRVAVEVTEGRVLQFGLFARALPTEKLATLLARLRALVGSDRVGAPALVDSYRPGAFRMAAFDPKSETSITGGSGLTERSSVRESARFVAHEGRAPRAFRTADARVTQDAVIPLVLRRFRSPVSARVVLDQGRPARVTTDRRGVAGGAVRHCEGPWRSSGDWWARPWNSDEWDVTLSDGVAYRICQARDTGAWVVEGVVD